MDTSATSGPRRCKSGRSQRDSVFSVLVCTIQQVISELAQCCDLTRRLVVAGRGWSIGARWAAGALKALSLLIAISLWQSLPLAFAIDSTPPLKLEGRLHSLPSTFESNMGQADSSVRFLSRGSGYTVLFRDHEADFILAVDRHFNVLDGSGYRPRPISPDEFVAKYL